MSQTMAKSAEVAVKRATTNGPGARFFEGAAVFRAHLGKACAPSKESSGFSKMRTFRKPVRIFEGNAHLRNQGGALDPVPLTRKVADPLVAASFALFA